MKTSRIAIAFAALLAVGSVSALAGNTAFFTSKNGDVTFPISPPANGQPGALDNTSVGATTPAPGNFTSLKSADGLVCATATPATAVDSVFFVATRAYVLVSVSEVHAVAAGGASAVQIVRDTGTAAPGTGTDLLTNNTNAGFDLNATANTVQVGALVAAATRTFAAGDRLSFDFANAIQSSAGVAMTACFAPQ